MKLLEVNALKKHFPLRGGLFGRATGYVYAVDGVTFDIAKGETLSLVGESGCGKSTVGRAILRLTPITDGEVLLDGERIDTLSAGRLRAMRRRVQVVFQDPFSSLDPRQRVRDIIAEPMVNFGLARGSDLDDRVAALMDKVRLPRDALRRFPHEFSGGQRQRIGIARALALRPDLIVADEPVSALDVSVQAQVLLLLKQLQARRNLAFLFVSHDLGVIRWFCSRVAVMYLGRIVEQGPAVRVFGSPRHPYTRMLRDASPVPDPARRGVLPRVVGEIPSAAAPPPGCHFHPRCPLASGICRATYPDWTEAAGHGWACHHPD
jgi:peptide/nickel transport system ATP-binding protein